jgi:hypothetical protein
LQASSFFWGEGERKKRERKRKREMTPKRRDGREPDDPFIDRGNAILERRNFSGMHS